MFCSFKSGVLIAAAALGALSTTLSKAPGSATAAPASSDARPAAGLIVRNARIWTVNPAQPQADAVAVAVLNGRDRYDGHMILVNSKVLALAGITSKTPDPPGGVIVRDATGQPTGALKDAATELLQHIAPPLSSAQRRRAIDRALHEAALRGVTIVQDMTLDYGDLAVYSQLLDEGKLSVRVYGAPPIAKI
jgi:predicted amidohydrolase YtcJ